MSSRVGKFVVHAPMLAKMLQFPSDVKIVGACVQGVDDLVFILQSEKFAPVESGKRMPDVTAVYTSVNMPLFKGFSFTKGGDENAKENAADDSGSADDNEGPKGS